MNDIASTNFSLNVLKKKQEQNSKITEQKVGFSIHNQHKTENTNDKSEMPISENPKAQKPKKTSEWTNKDLEQLDLGVLEQ